MLVSRRAFTTALSYFPLRVPQSLNAFRFFNASIKSAFHTNNVLRVSTNPVNASKTAEAARPHLCPINSKQMEHIQIKKGLPDKPTFNAFLDSIELGNIAKVKEFLEANTLDREHIGKAISTLIGSYELFMDTGSDEYRQKCRSRYLYSNHAECWTHSYDILCLLVDAGWGLFDTQTLSVILAESFRLKATPGIKDFETKTQDPLFIQKLLDAGAGYSFPKNFALGNSLSDHHGLVPYHEATREEYLLDRLMTFGAFHEISIHEGGALMFWGLCHYSSESHLYKFATIIRERGENRYSPSFAAHALQDKKNLLFSTVLLSGDLNASKDDNLCFRSTFLSLLFTKNRANRDGRNYISESPLLTDALAWGLPIMCCDENGRNLLSYAIEFCMHELQTALSDLNKYNQGSAHHQRALRRSQDHAIKQSELVFDLMRSEVCAKGSYDDLKKYHDELAKQNLWPEIQETVAALAAYLSKCERL